MLDPGAYGTLLIGLGIAEQNAMPDPRRRHPGAGRRRSSSIRSALASIFRRAASALDRPAVTIGEVTKA